MNKKVLLGILIIVICLVVVIVFINHNEKHTGNDEIMAAGWTFNNDIKALDISNDALDIFNKASEEYTKMTFEPIALLGTQVVAGTNYMFLCKGTTVTESPQTELKVVIVYNDLNNKSEITSVKDFYYTKYVNKNIDNNSEVLSGGWQVVSSSKNGELGKSVQTIFDNATSTLTGMSYIPIAVLGTQVVAGTNYAILCYGSASYENTTESIYLITIYNDLSNNSEIVSQAYINISEFNK